MHFILLLLNAVAPSLSDKFSWIILDLSFLLSFDGDVAEGASGEASVETPWSRSIEDLHGDSNLPSPVSTSSIPRSTRHSLRWDTHRARRIIRIICNHLQINWWRYGYSCGSYG